MKMDEIVIKKIEEMNYRDYSYYEKIRLKGV